MLENPEKTVPRPKSVLEPVGRYSIDKANPADFDGHTNFARLTPYERLLWLDQARAFIIKSKQATKLGDPENRQAYKQD